jgi:spore coat protein U-like protein
MTSIPPSDTVPSGAKALRTLALRRLMAMGLTAVAAPACAVNCNVSTVGVSFGGYDVFSEQSLDGAGSVAVSCDASTTYSIALSPGAGSFGSRRMTSGSHTLNYNLYDDATHSTIWGDGSAGTVVVGGTAVTATHTVYGRIPARQNAYVGSYGDAIVVTLSF